MKHIKTCFSLNLRKNQDHPLVTKGHNIKSTVSMVHMERLQTLLKYSFNICHLNKEERSKYI